MRSKSREHLCCSDALPNAPTNTCSIVEDDTCWHSFDVFEDVLERLADTFSILAREYLRKTNIRVWEGQYEITQALLRFKDEEICLSKVGLRFAWCPVEVEILFCRITLILLQLLNTSANRANSA